MEARNNKGISKCKPVEVEQRSSSRACGRKIELGFNFQGMGRTGISSEGTGGDQGSWHPRATIEQRGCAVKIELSSLGGGKKQPQPFSIGVENNRDKKYYSVEYSRKQ